LKIFERRISRGKNGRRGGVGEEGRVVLLIGGLKKSFYETSKNV